MPPQYAAGSQRSPAVGSVEAAPDRPLDVATSLVVHRVAGLNRSRALLALAHLNGDRIPDGAVSAAKKQLSRASRLVRGLPPPAAAEAIANRVQNVPTTVSGEEFVLQMVADGLLLDPLPIDAVLAQLRWWKTPARNVDLAQSTRGPALVSARDRAAIAAAQQRLILATRGGPAELPPFPDIPANLAHLPLDRMLHAAGWVFRPAQRPTTIGLSDVTARLLRVGPQTAHTLRDGLNRLRSTQAHVYPPTPPVEVITTWLDTQSWVRRRRDGTVRPVTRSALPTTEIDMAVITAARKAGGTISHRQALAVLKELGYVPSGRSTMLRTSPLLEPAGDGYRLREARRPAHD